MFGNFLLVKKIKSYFGLIENPKISVCNYFLSFSLDYYLIEYQIVINKVKLILYMFLKKFKIKWSRINYFVKKSKDKHGRLTVKLFVKALTPKNTDIILTGTNR